MTVTDLLERIEGDGSAVLTCQNGVSSDDVPACVAGLWSELESLLQEVAMLGRDIEVALEAEE